MVSCGEDSSDAEPVFDLDIDLWDKEISLNKPDLKKRYIFSSDKKTMDTKQMSGVKQLKKRLRNKMKTKWVYIF